MNRTELVKSIESRRLRKLLRWWTDASRRGGNHMPAQDIQTEKAHIVVRVEQWAKIRELAYIKGTTIAQQVALAFHILITDWEGEQGEIVPQADHIAAAAQIHHQQNKRKKQQTGIENENN